MTIITVNGKEGNFNDTVTLILILMISFSACLAKLWMQKLPQTWSHIPKRYCIAFFCLEILQSNSFYYARDLILFTKESQWVLTDGC